MTLREKYEKEGGVRDAYDASEYVEWLEKKLEEKVVETGEALDNLKVPTWGRQMK